MIIAIALWILGGILIYLTNRVGRLEQQTKVLNLECDRFMNDLRRMLEDSQISSHYLRAQMDELTSTLGNSKKKPAVLKESKPVTTSRRGRSRTDEERKAASERAKKRWAERKAAAKNEASRQPGFDISRVDTRVIQ